jgi:sporulation related protein
VARAADAGRSTVLALRSRRLRRPAARDGGAAPLAACVVRLGPYHDRATALAVRARVHRDWPAAELMADGEQFYVQVASTPNRQYAERLAERLRQSGDPVELHSL